MTPAVPCKIAAAVEGLTDEAVARRLILHVGAEAGPVYGRNGKPHLKERIAGYNNAAQHAPWFVLVDLDRDADCAPTFRSSWVPTPARSLCFRVAVRSLEAWLIADAEALAEFLGVASSRVPRHPERLDSPKLELVNLANHSRRAAIRKDMTPRPGSGRPVGPAYSSRIIEFASKSWRPEVARMRSDSLARAIASLARLVAAT
jgi:hypothetical protein